MPEFQFKLNFNIQTQTTLTHLLTSVSSLTAGSCKTTLSLAEVWRRRTTAVSFAAVLGGWWGGVWSPEASRLNLPPPEETESELELEVYEMRRAGEEEWTGEGWRASLRGLVERLVVFLPVESALPIRMMAGWWHERG